VTHIRKALPPLEPCTDCDTSGLVSGLFHEMDCAACDGVGWLPVAGIDITQHLGRSLAKLVRMNRILREAVPQGEAEHHPQSGRAGVRGNFVGD